jgi:hypothetical protein
MSDKPVKELAIKLTHPDNHPIVIGVGLNEPMHCWELQIIVGNFKTRADAEAYAKPIKEFIEDEADGVLDKV